MTVVHGDPTCCTVAPKLICLEKSATIPIKFYMIHASNVKLDLVSPQASEYFGGDKRLLLTLNFIWKAWVATRNDRLLVYSWLQNP